MITRVLQCGNPEPVTSCLQDRTIDVLAGRKGSLGAVGKPDDLRELYAYPFAHCDGGDYFERPGYPQTAAQANSKIQQCAAIAFRRLNSAVEAAGQLVDAEGRLRPPEADIRSCDLGAEISSSSASAGSAKCQVLNQTGRALHAIEDFWSHSNWGDAAGPGALSVANPPGLTHSAIPDFFSYATHANTPAAQLTIPAGLITGCDDSSPTEKVLRECGKPDTAGDRVKHSVLNKDRGQIDPRTGATSDPTTDRGKVGAGANFARTVAGARSHASQTWTDLTAMIRSRYPGVRGESIVFALANDHPWTSCAVSGNSSRAHSAPVGAGRPLRSTTVTIRNATGDPLACRDAILDGGEWASMPPDVIASGSSGSFRTESNAKAAELSPEGVARYAIGSTPYLLRIYWKNPAAGFNKYACGFYLGGQDVTSSAPYSCSQSGGSGGDATPSFSVTRRSRAVAPPAALRGRDQGPITGDASSAGRPAPPRRPLLLDDEAIDPCPGYARNFSLRVDGVDCENAFEAAARAISRDDLCPTEWRPREGVRVDGFNESGDGLPPLVLCRDRDDEADDGEGRDRFAFHVLAH